MLLLRFSKFTFHHKNEVPVQRINRVHVRMSCPRCLFVLSLEVTFWQWISFEDMISAAEMFPPWNVDSEKDFAAVTSYLSFSELWGGCYMFYAVVPESRDKGGSANSQRQRWWDQAHNFTSTEKNICLIIPLRTNCKQHFWPTFCPCDIVSRLFTVTSLLAKKKSYFFVICIYWCVQSNAIRWPFDADYMGERCIV